MRKHHSLAGQGLPVAQQFVAWDSGRVPAHLECVSHGHYAGCTPALASPTQVRLVYEALQPTSLQNYLKTKQLHRETYVGEKKDARTHHSLAGQGFLIAQQLVAWDSGRMPTLLEGVPDRHCAGWTPALASPAHVRALVRAPLGSVALAVLHTLCSADVYRV